MVAMTEKHGRFRLLVGKLKRRERMNLLLVRVSWGALYGLCAGLLYALAADFIPVPVSPPVMTALCLAAGVAAGSASALLARPDVKGLLIRADRVLGNRELSSTAFELDTTGKPSLYTEAILEDAADSLSSTTPSALLRRPGIRPLPFLPALLAAAVFLSFFPLDLAGLFSRAQEPDPGMKILGEDLESIGKQLEKGAAERGAQRQLELSRELQKLGRNFQNQKIDQGEAEERLAQIENRLAQEYELALKAFSETRPGKPGEGKGAEDGGKAGAPNGAEQKAQKDGETGSGDASGAGDIGEALDRLSRKKKDLAGGDPGSGKDLAMGGLGSTEGAGENPDGQEDAKQGPGSAEKGPEEAAGSKPGTAPAEEKTGAPTKIDTGGEKDTLRAKAAEAEGDKATLLMRALPKRTGARVADSALLRGYERTAESALAREEVPMALQDYVKKYFMAIGMLGSDSEGR
jgi:hypothetical protein